MADNTYSEPRQAVHADLGLRKLLKDRDDNSEYITFVQDATSGITSKDLTDADEFEHLYRLARIKENDNYL